METWHVLVTHKSDVEVNMIEAGNRRKSRCLELRDAQFDMQWFRAFGVPREE